MASRLVELLSEIEITLEVLLDTDRFVWFGLVLFLMRSRLVHYLESPAFVHVRIHLLKTGGLLLFSSTFLIFALLPFQGIISSLISSKRFTGSSCCSPKSARVRLTVLINQVLTPKLSCSFQNTSSAIGGGFLHAAGREQWHEKKERRIE